MKILIISKYALAKEVGFESRLFAMSRWFVKKGHEVRVIASVDNFLGQFPPINKTYTHVVIEGVKATWIKSLSYTKSISIRRVLSWIDFELKLLRMKGVEAPDLIIVSSMSLLTVLNGVRLKKKFNCPLIFEIRDIWPLSLKEYVGLSPANPLVKVLAWIEKWGYRKADLVVGTMPNIAAHVQEVTGKPIECACVPFGVDLLPDEEEGTAGMPAIDFGIPTDKFVIGYTGSIGLWNGLATFVSVIKQLKDDPRLHFVIAGGGGLKATYMASLANCDNVQFLPKVPRHEVPHILAKCNVLYLGTLKRKTWDYGWSLNKIMDYMLAGKPVLASYSGFPSMINEAESGVIVPAEDEAALLKAIDHLLAMPTEALEAMGERGKQWIYKNRRWSTLADDYLDLMQHVLGGIK